MAYQRRTLHKHLSARKGGAGIVRKFFFQSLKERRYNGLSICWQWQPDWPLAKKSQSIASSILTRDPRHVTHSTPLPDANRHGPLMLLAYITEAELQSADLGIMAAALVVFFVLASFWPALVVKPIWWMLAHQVFLRAYPPK